MSISKSKISNLTRAKKKFFRKRRVSLFKKTKIIIDDNEKVFVMIRRFDNYYMFNSTNSFEDISRI